MISNIDELRQQLAKAFADLSSGSVDVKTTEALANLTGKLINSCKVELEYKQAKAKNGTLSIPFLDTKDKA